MKTETQAGRIELNTAGLALCAEAGVLVGEMLILMFMWRWGVDDLLAYYPELTAEMVDAALVYPVENPDTPEGMFYYSVDVMPLLAATGWL
jgi:hypothetical protein